MCQIVIQEIPYQQIVRDPHHPPMDIREQLVFFLIDRGALNVAIGGSTLLFLDMSDKALFQSSKTNLISKRCAATLTITDSMRLESKTINAKASSKYVCVSIETNDRDLVFPNWVIWLLGKLHLTI